MGSQDEPHIALRRLAPVEQYYSARHHLGLYLSVIVTCRYNAPTPDRKIDAVLLYPALGRLVDAQPMLRVGIAKADTNESVFCHIKTVDLTNHVSFKTLDSGETVEQYNDQIASEQGWHHDQAWQSTDKIPPWRITIIEPSAAASELLPGVQDVIFSYHHALMDGIGGKMFHENLLKELNSELCRRQETPSNETSPSSTLQFLNAPQVPHSQDQAIAFENSVPYLVKTLWNELGPTRFRAKTMIPWHDKPIDFSIPYVTCCKIVDIQPAVLARFLKACREHSTSITSLIHALTLASLATRLPASQASCFVASTPISLRPFLGPDTTDESNNLLRVLVTSYQHEFTPTLVSEFRESAKNASLDNAIWKIGQRVKAELSKRLATLPKDDVNGLMKYNSDWFDYFQRKDGQPRRTSWETSNIGVFENDSDAPGFTVSRVCFTNGAMVTGAPVALGVGSVPGACLTIALSWQKGAVADELMDNLARDLTSFADNFNETGSFAAK